MVFGGLGWGGVTNIFVIYRGGVENFFLKGLGGGVVKCFAHHMKMKPAPHLVINDSCLNVTWNITGLVSVVFLCMNELSFFLSYFYILTEISHFTSLNIDLRNNMELLHCKFGSRFRLLSI